MKVVIVGAGAMGSLFGGKLFKITDVQLFTRNQNHVRKINQSGLLIESSGDRSNIYYVRAFDDVEKAEEFFDVAILFTKSYDTKQVLYNVKKLLRPKGIVVTFQNGIGNKEILKEVFDEEQIIIGTTAQAAYIREPGVIYHAGIGTTYMEINEKNGSILKELGRMLNDAGLETILTNDIEPVIWNKLIINSGINAITAIFKITNGELISNPKCKLLVEKVVEEAKNIAIKLGINIKKDIKDEVFSVCERTFRNKSSMLQDILKGSQTEISYINGAIVRCGVKLGVSVPYNTCLTEMVKILESTYREDSLIHREF